MNRMLNIGRLYAESDVDTAKLCADIEIKNSPDDITVYQMWYEVEKQYEAYLCTERADAFVAAVLLYAMERGYDISSETVVTDKLLFQLTNFFIPVVSKNIDSYKEISITAETCSDELKCEGKVGTGVSGGVDSFYTLLKNRNSGQSKFKITHGTFLNVGAAPTKELHEERLKSARNIAKELQIELVVVNSNMNGFLGDEFVKSHTFRSCSAILAIQKLFSVFYYSSGISIADFQLNGESTAYFDLLNLMCLSTRNTTFYSYGGEADRGEKINYISNFLIAQKYLNVCVVSEENCNQCFKCVRTMLELYAEDVLDKYGDVFDIQFFHQNKKWYLINCVRNINQDLNLKETYLKLKKKKQIPLSVMIVGTVKRWRANIIALLK